MFSPKWKMLFYETNSHGRTNALTETQLHTITQDKWRYRMPGRTMGSIFFPSRFLFLLGPPSYPPLGDPTHWAYSIVCHEYVCLWYSKISYTIQSII
jgi:hypothetical protein